jgi:hypothetical protein
VKPSWDLRQTVSAKSENFKVTDDFLHSAKVEMMIDETRIVIRQQTYGYNVGISWRQRILFIPSFRKADVDSFKPTADPGDYFEVAA